ncbi:MerR family transcriptional regulator [bacterium]|nr:MerR family transcriptional regulator [bacterium]
MKEKPLNQPISATNGKQMLKMRELAEATGVKKPTILFYIKEGLLPAPVKTSPNVAFYPFSFVERINLIRKLQDQHRLSLTRIKEILLQKDSGKEIAPLIEMHDTIYGRGDSVKIDKETFCKQTGLNARQVKEAKKAKLLIPLQEDSFDSEDLALGNLLHQIFELGLSLKEITYYSKLGQKIVNEEMKIHERLIQGTDIDKAIMLTLDLSRIARVMRGYVIDRLFQQAAGRQKILSQPDEEQMEENRR